MAFASAAIVGKQRYVVEHESAIFVSVSSNQLQIFVRASSYDLATQINVPLLNIASYEVTSTYSELAGTPMHTTQIRLSDSADVPLFINADEQSERDVGI